MTPQDLTNYQGLMTLLTIMAPKTYRYKIERDPDPTSPRDGDNVCSIAARPTRRYSSPDKDAVYIAPYHDVTFEIEITFDDDVPHPDPDGLAETIKAKLSAWLAKPAPHYWGDYGPCIEDTLHYEALKALHSGESDGCGSQWWSMSKGTLPFDVSDIDSDGIVDIRLTLNWIADDDILFIQWYDADYDGSLSETDSENPDFCLTITRQSWYALMGKDNTTPYATVARNEVEVLNHYYQDDVYGYTIIEIDCDGNETEIDSCWGFYGSNIETNGILDHVDAMHHDGMRQAMRNI